MQSREKPIALPGYEDLKLVVSVRPVNGPQGLSKGVRSVSVFLVNYRPPAPDVRRDAAYVFQPELSLHGEQPFVPRPDLHCQGSKDWDDQVADLQYRDVYEYAVG